jgi:hypothetical protein
VVATRSKRYETTTKASCEGGNSNNRRESTDAKQPEKGCDLGDAGQNRKRGVESEDRERPSTAVRAFLLQSGLRHCYAPFARHRSGLHHCYAPSAHR